MRAKTEIENKAAEFLFGWLCAVLICLPVGAHAEVTCLVDIPAESLSTEIVAFTRQCKIQTLLLSEGNELERIRGNPVVGFFAPADALRRILDNSGWTFSSIVEDKVSIERDRRPVSFGLADAPVLQVTVFAGKRTHVAPRTHSPHCLCPHGIHGQPQGGPWCWAGADEDTYKSLANLGLFRRCLD